MPRYDGQSDSVADDGHRGDDELGRDQEGHVLGRRVALLRVGGVGRFLGRVNPNRVHCVHFHLRVGMVRTRESQAGCAFL